MARKNLWFSVGFALVVIAASLAWARWQQPAEFLGVPITDGEPAADFTLSAVGNQSISLSDFRGKVVLLYFGYTHCPDVCPATLAEVRVALEKLGSASDNVQVIMVSVDPERDTPDTLAEYVHRFDDRYIGLTGSLDQLTPIAAAHKIVFRKHEGSAATGYLVDHSAKLLLIDQQGNTRLAFPFGVTGEEMADVLRIFL